MKQTLLLILGILLYCNLLADTHKIKISFLSLNKQYELRIIDTIAANKTIHYDTIINPKTKKKEVYRTMKADDYVWGLFRKDKDSLLYKITSDALI